MMIAKIKAIITDVDGVLTDGGIYYDSIGNETKKFNAKDGMAIGMLRQANFKVGVITGRSSAMVARRVKELNIDFYAHGISDKRNSFEDFKQQYQLQNAEIAYIGDDINDMVVMLHCGLKACPSDAPDYIKDKVDYITQRAGGHGALREFSDWILIQQGKLNQVLETKYKFQQ